MALPIETTMAVRDALVLLQQAMEKIQSVAEQLMTAPTAIGLMGDASIILHREVMARTEQKGDYRGGNAS